MQSEAPGSMPIASEKTLVTQENKANCLNFKDIPDQNQNRPNYEVDRTFVVPDIHAFRQDLCRVLFEIQDVPSRERSCEGGPLTY
jgi:hypothetical protein